MKARAGIIMKGFLVMAFIFNAIIFFWAMTKPTSSSLDNLLQNMSVLGLMLIPLFWWLYRKGLFSGKSR